MPEFYEQYWQQKGWEIGEGFALEQRKAKLRKGLATLPPGSRVLDAGSGNGEFSLFLTDLGYVVDAVDVSVTAVERAQAAVPGVQFAVASLEAALPFDCERFQAAWCTEVLEHIFDVHHALTELNRVLEPQGLLILTTPFHALVKNLTIALLGFETHYNPYVSHIRFFTRKSLARCLRLAGFQPLSWSGVGRAWPLWMSHFVVARKTDEPGHPPRIVG
jgi:SAM-dependent methyltransferase